MLSFGSLGRSRMIFGSFGSMPSAMAGRLSVIRFTHSRWMAISGAGSPTQMSRNMVRTSAMFEDSRKQTVFLMFA